MRTLTAFLLLLMTAASVSARTITLDLAVAGATTKLSGTDGEVVSFIIVNSKRTARYDITVEERVLALPTFPDITGLGAFASANEACTIIIDSLRALGVTPEPDEPEIGRLVSRIRGQLAACDNPAIKVKAEEVVAQTVRMVPGEYTVRAGIEIVLTVTRSGGTPYTVIVSGGERGTWLVTYGAGILPSRDQKFFTKSIGDEQFEIAPETDRKPLKVSPAVFFTWLPRRHMLDDWSFGPTAGLGLGSSPAVYVGYGATYNQNLGFIGGVGFAHHSRLIGRYSEGEIIKENLGEDELNEGVFRAAPFFGVTFRFANNPFGGDDKGDKGDSGKKAETQKPETPKPETKKNGSEETDQI